MEYRLQALEKFKAKFEAADVFARLDALEEADTPGLATLDADQFIRRIETLERRLLPADHAEAIERRLEALVQLTSDGLPTDETHANVSIGSNQAVNCSKSSNDEGHNNIISQMGPAAVSHECAVDSKEKSAKSVTDRTDLVWGRTEPEC
ncbi:hypothetical protein A1Q1_00666 [Trichosporon asahii var. asahii CBS 2479]|uniref:Uncharacterized protein n=1 Tax=Trichosporon asahii var. asahii (strain ATCC 90039 / CBS 2479 / JCM 2466 / KCTC 7840 / NBRC 103889/ NCYC 2677 / UAMH 7654) TaxID=1186058 RepID=J6F760_TRIAS|nr:hypothetical protein A1Q1_00666 [Trichosporon asahii var. asahii CBS 2479]EJT52919.1 hypothetical protein A1Q1_00666 [Trichosporon asahii var. asahii CBS 2479]